LSVGETVPNTMKLRSFPGSVQKRVAAIRLFRYTLLQGEVVIVDPASNKIVAVVGR
jgi:hypothetical protein